MKPRSIADLVRHPHRNAGTRQKPTHCVRPVEAIETVSRNVAIYETANCRRELPISLPRVKFLEDVK